MIKVSGDLTNDPIPRLWRQRDLLDPLLTKYGARVLGKALAKHFGLDTSRTACEKLAALMMALTGFETFFTYSDFYISLAAEDPAVADCLRELQGIGLS